jgi:hypothetical protein
MIYGDLIWNEILHIMVLSVSSLHVLLLGSEVGWGI